MDHLESIWKGKRVRLRAFSASDWQAYSAWNEDDEQARGLEYVPLPRSPDADKRWAEEEATRKQEGDNVRLTIENEVGDVVGDLTVHHCDRRVGTLSYGISIARDYRRRGYAKDAIQIMLRYYFDELRYNKVTVLVSDFNEASIRLHESLCFRKEGQLRQVVFTRGRYYDQYVYGLTADEFRTGVGAR
jgi:RimJ/RimL family protein N-acetyltransferase